MKTVSIELTVRLDLDIDDTAVDVDIDEVVNEFDYTFVSETLGVRVVSEEIVDNRIVDECEE